MYTASSTVQSFMVPCSAYGETTQKQITTLSSLQIIQLEHMRCVHARNTDLTCNSILSCTCCPSLAWLFVYASLTALISTNEIRSDNTQHFPKSTFYGKLVWGLAYIPERNARQLHIFRNFGQKRHVYKILFVVIRWMNEGYVLKQTKSKYFLCLSQITKWCLIKRRIPTYLSRYTSFCNHFVLFTLCDTR